MNKINLIRAEGSHGYLLTLKLWEEDGVYYVGEDFEQNYQTDVFNNLDDAMEFFEYRLEERENR